jgi:voltage-gated potassium channel
VPSFFTFVLGRMLGTRWLRSFHTRMALCGLVLSAAVILGGSAAIVPLEEDAPGATITSFPRAVWWAVETATTVGYGDMYPVTAGGRTVAVVVMLVGITAFSVGTAALATWFVGRAAHDLHKLGAALKHFQEDHARVMAGQLRAMHDRFDRLEHRMEDRG